MDNRGLTETDESIFDLLAVVAKKPSLYLGTRSLTGLHGFLSGYESGLGKLRGMWKGQKEWDGFHQWVADKLGFSNATSGWCNMILKHSKDEEDALERFFDLLETFKTERGIK